MAARNAHRNAEYDSVIRNVHRHRGDRDAARPLLDVGNFYEELGVFVKRGIIDPEIACDFWFANLTGDWGRMAPAIAIIRRTQGPAVWENFEYMKDLGAAWIARHPNGAYPAGRRREPLEDVWLAADAARLRPEPER